MPLARTHRPSLARRAFLALMLYIGFYTLALVVVGVLLLVIWADLASGHFHFQIVLVCLIGAGAILIGIIPRADRLDTPWPQMTAAQHPLLFERLEMIAARAGQRMPDEVYLLPDLNAWVTDRGRGGRRRVMGIGLPLICILNIPQFAAVIAHEFGHYYGGDTRLGPWIHKTHATIGRTLHNLNQNSIRIIEAPFRAYGTMFLRVSMSVSREQEFTADRFAASIVGPDAVATSLKRLAAYDAPVRTYWERLLMPTVHAGYNPSIIGGLMVMYFSKDAAEQAREDAEKIVAESVQNPFDTHPCLRDRVAALQGLPTVETADASDSDSALTLLGELDPVEDQILHMYLGEEAAAKLTPIEWGEVGERVFISRWLKMRENNRALLESWTADEVGAVFYPGNVSVSELRDVDGNHMDPDVQFGLLYLVVLACLSLAVLDAGWTLVTRPDVGLFFAREETQCDVVRAVNALLRGEVPQSEWTDFCKQTGIAGRLMTGGMSPTGPGTRWVPDVIEPHAPPVVHTGVRYEGGNGATIDVPIIIRGAASESEAVAAELSRLREWYGVAEQDWSLLGRTRQEYQGRQIDVVEIVLKNGRPRSLYFDVTTCHGIDAAGSGSDAHGGVS